MDNAQYLAYLEELQFGRKIVTHNGRTATNKEELDFIARAEGLAIDAPASEADPFLAEEPKEKTLGDLTVAELKEKIIAYGLTPPKGAKRADLVKLVADAMNEVADDEASESEGKELEEVTDGAEKAEDESTDEKDPNASGDETEQAETPNS